MISTPNTSDTLSQTSSVSDRSATKLVPGVDRPTPLWARLALPSVSDLIFVIIVLVLLFDPRVSRLLSDPDTGWHIRNGEHILATHSIPRVDYFSSTMAGKPWYAWEWLYDVVLGAVHRLAGLNGVVLLSALLIALTFALLFEVTNRRSNVVIALLVTLPTLGVSGIHFLARPHIITWLFTLVWFVLLDRYRTSGSWKFLAWLPPLMVLWVNLHGGFVLGIILPTVFLVSTLWEAWSSSSSDDKTAAFGSARKLGWATLGTIAATFATPYGYALHIHVFKYLRNRYLMDNISEFMSPNFHDPLEKLFVVLLVLWAVGAATSVRKVTALDLLLFAFSVYAGLYAARNLPVGGILLSVTAAPSLLSGLNSAAGRDDISAAACRIAASVQSFANRMGSLDSKLRSHILPVLLTILLAVVCLNGGRLYSARILDASFSQKDLPVGAANYIAGKGIKSGIFTTDSWGAYLIYRLYPNYSVAVDDRHDMYGNAFLRDYQTVLQVRPNWQAALKKYDITRVLVTPESPLAQILAADTRWKQEYSDPTALIFVQVGQ